MTLVQFQLNFFLNRASWKKQCLNKCVLQRKNFLSNNIIEMFL